MGIFARQPISLRLVIVFGSIGSLMLILMAVTFNSVGALRLGLQGGQLAPEQMQRLIE